MRKLVFFVFLLVSLSLSGDWNKDDNVGVWLTQKEKGKFSIFERDGKYYGVLIWGENPDKLDTENPDESLRSRKLVGSEILSGFVWDGEEWVDGEIYDPREGETYSCKMWLEDKNTLKIRGFVGVSLFGRTVTWTRVKN